MIDPTGVHGFENHPNASSFLDATPVPVAAGAATTVDAAFDPA